MPGLVGIVSLTREKVNLSLMQAMRQAIQHQAWYQTDDYVNTGGTVSISRVNLGIINTERQPYTARQGKVKVFLHGEIYNSEALNRNPLEFIYQVYEQEGPGFAAKLNGSFVTIVVDEDQNTVFLANDRIATKPLFYFTDGKALYFSPEMKSLLLIPSLRRDLNLAAIADFLARGHFTREHTLIEQLKTLDNATIVRITEAEGTYTQHKYWDYILDDNGKDKGEKHYQQALASLLQTAVEKRLQTNNTYGVLLSGGYDSRGILGCYLNARGSEGLKTISWGREELIPHSDCAIAKTLANQLGADHRFYELKAEDVISDFHNFVWLGEGMTWYPESYQVFSDIKEQQSVDIVLRGDECFGWEGLMVHDEATMLRILYLDTLRNTEAYRKILTPVSYQQFCELDDQIMQYVTSTTHNSNLHNRKDYIYLNTRLKHFINPLNYPKNYAIESFTPLLDYDILDFVSTLPVKYRLSKTLYRKTVLEMFPQLFNEIAQVRNDIDWPASFRTSKTLQHFTYTTLVEEQNAFSEFFNISALTSQMDDFFHPASNPTVPQSAMDKAKASVGKLWKRSMLSLRDSAPSVFNLAHRSAYTFREWTGRTKETLPFDRVLIRTLILKVWGDIFLNLPVVQSEADLAKLNTTHPYNTLS